MPNSSGSSGIYFVSLCRPISEWCSMTVYVANSTVCRLTSVNNIQPHVIRCRELIFTEPYILATPLLHDKSFKVITHVSLYRTGRLQTRLHKLGLECTESSAVSINDLEACLRYTLQAKLSPEWNKVGLNLIRGRNFLSDTSKVDAVRIELNVNLQEISISVHSHSVKVIRFKLCDMVCSESVLCSFIRGKPLAVIQQHEIVNGWCHVLPSMKKGCVVEIRHNIPGDSPFKTYLDIKKYWKNLYGYRLPENDDDLFYVQVCFGFSKISNTFFTYPSCCVLPSEPVIFGRTDRDSLSDSFMCDVTAKLTSVCNSTSIQYTTSDISNVQKKNESSANLTSFKPAVKLHSLTDTVHSLLTSNSHALCLGPKHSFGAKGVPSNVVNDLVKKDVIGVNSASQVISKYVPIFNKTTRQSSTSQLVVKKAQPSFAVSSISRSVVAKSQPSLSLSSSSQSIVTKSQPSLSLSSSSQSIVTKSQLSLSLSSSSQSIVTKSQPSLSLSSSSQSIVTKSQLSLHVSSTSQMVVDRMQQSSTSQSTILSSLSSGKSENNVRKYPVFKSLSVSNTPADMHCKTSNSTQVVTPRQPPTNKIRSTPDKIMKLGVEEKLENSDERRRFTASDAFSLTKRQIADLTDVACLPSQSISNYVTSSQDSSKQNHKRKSEIGAEDGNVVKKIRSKPQVKYGIDLSAMLRTDDKLSKVNAATLVAWLKERGINCKSKDKKSDLVERVLDAIRLKSNEQ